MHLLVLSAFRPGNVGQDPEIRYTVSMHLLVLSAFRPEEGAFVHLDIPVSMHLLVLSAFQLAPLGWMSVGLRSFNAPSGAQCFPTDGDDGASQESAVSMHLLVLSAFQRHKQVRGHLHRLVSMHLLVLSAFQPLRQPSAVARYGLFQCTFWCSVLSNPPACEREEQDDTRVSMHLLVLSAFQRCSLSLKA